MKHLAIRWGKEPSECPSCGGKIKVIEEGTTIVWKCTNPSCGKNGSTPNW